MDFFGGQGPTSKGPVSKIVTKKVISASRPTSAPNGRPVPNPNASSSSSTSSPASRQTVSKPKSAPTSRGVSGVSISSALSKSHLSATSSRASTPNGVRRKRTPSPVRSESDSSDSSAGRGSVIPKSQQKKRKRAEDAASSGAGPRLGTPLSLSGASRSKAPHGPNGGKDRQLWCIDKVDERGEWSRGWAGFVGCEEAVRGDVSGWAGGKGAGKGNVEKYIAYFPQEGFGNQDPLPTVELLYPATGCKERFVLLVPTSAREFNPILELRTVLKTILEHYIPPSHSHIFGTLSDSIDLDPLPLLPSRLHSPAPTSSALATPPPDSSSSPTPQRLGETIGDAIRKAIASNRRDGPGLLKAIERYNSAMADLQRSGEMREWLLKKSAGMGEGGWSQIVEIVHEQAYSRVVGPYSEQLEHHPKHPEEVSRLISAKEDSYGELRHKLMSQIILETGLTASSTFVDLGSGVGNCVLQTALQAGCRSLGVELLPVPAHCARLQVAEVKRRWSMWGLNGNLAVEVVEGDFRGSSHWLKSADVVLVNNEVFPPSLNDELKYLFLELKNGAKIVSLKPFVNEGFRMNESNCDSFDAIVRLSQHNYYNDWVSWKGDSGKYYIQVIDRSMREKFDEELKSGVRRRR